MTTVPSTTYLDRAIAGELAELHGTQAGRNNTLFHVAARLYAFVEAGACDEATMTDLLNDAGRSTGLGRDEVRSTLKSARRRAATMSEADRQALAAKCAGQPVMTYQVEPAAPEACEPPSEQWQATAGGLVTWSQHQLYAHPAPVAYLRKRGFDEETIFGESLGYNPVGRWSERSKWGLAPDQDGNTRMWLPAGIVIPWYADGALWKLSLRRETVKKDQERYKTISGSANALYGADALAPGKPAMLVEGVFDALAVRQAAGDLVATVASGTSGARRVRWLSRLALCSEVLVSLDADGPGDEASRYWLDVLPNARRHRPWWSDPAQMLQDGADVRAWVLSGLRQEPQAAPWAAEGALGLWQDVRAYWQGELAQQSAALERLRTICGARGYGYQETTEALQAGARRDGAAAEPR